MTTKEPTSWGFYGGNFLEYDGTAYIIKMNTGLSLYLQYNEARSLSSLLRQVMPGRNKKARKSLEIQRRD